MKGFFTRIISAVYGYAGGLPEKKFTPNGNAVTSFGVAVGNITEGRGGWIRIAVWGEENGNKMIDFVTGKGQPVVAYGQLMMRKSKGKVYHDCRALALQDVKTGEVLAFTDKVGQKAWGLVGQTFVKLGEALDEREGRELVKKAISGVGGDGERDDVLSDF